MGEKQSDQTGAPLFQNMDEQEKIYAPEQVPGAALPADEVDVGGAASTGTAHARGSAASGAGRDPMAGAEGDQRTTTVVPVRPDMSAASPLPTPATPDDRRIDE